MNPFVYSSRLFCHDNPYDGAIYLILQANFNKWCWIRTFLHVFLLKIAIFYQAKDNLLYCLYKIK